VSKPLNSLYEGLIPLFNINKRKKECGSPSIRSFEQGSMQLYSKATACPNDRTNHQVLIEAGRGVGAIPT